MIPLVLLTGFLGAGKTTFLRRLLTPLIGAGVRPHVILNDYANADLDSATLRDLVPNIQPLTGSCVCCNSMDDLLGALDDLALGERDVVLVEANGTTDPLPLLEVLLLTRLQRRLPCLFHVHLWIGLALGLCVVGVSVSGSLIVFRSENEDALHKDLTAVKPGGQPTLGRPVTCSGRLRVGEMRDNGFLSGLYQMDTETTYLRE